MNTNSFETPLADKMLAAYQFKGDTGQILEWSPGQKEIMECILAKRSPDGKRRVHCMTTTQYGKSACIGAAVALRAALKGDKWAIVAGTQDKARIIMDYAVNYVIQHPILREQLGMNADKISKLKQERSKERLTFLKSGGELRVYSADSKNKQASGDALMGFGAPNVLEDESALVDDDIHAKVVRMVGGHVAAGKDFIMKIGNPFRRNHFLQSFQDDKYFKIVIDYHRAIREGRLTEEFIEEMRTKPYFSVFYEVLFPDEDAMDSKGWLPLITDTQLERAYVRDGQRMGENRLGVDVAGGGRNFSTMVNRGTNYAKLVYKKRTPDSMEYAGDVVTKKRELRVENHHVYIDRVGIGEGLFSRVNELVKNEFHGTRTGVVGVKAGEVATDSKRFVNQRAEMYWRLREWLLAGGQLEYDEDWEQLTHIYYKAADYNSRIQIMSKEQMLARGIDSPDVADALALTFRRSPEQAVLSENPDFAARMAYANQSQPNFDPYE